MKEVQSNYYDKLYSEKKLYHAHYKDSIYYVHWTQVIRLLRNVPNPKILEIGCGPGQLAEYLKDEGYTDYNGFDFSEKAIELAKKRVNQNFFVGNALDKANLNLGYNVVICLEVLEHVKEDLKILEHIKPGTPIIFSVPNFDDPSHVRWFTSERQVKSRYFKHVDIQRIIRIGNIYICYGIINSFKPTLLQNFLKSREDVGIDSFLKRIRFKVNNILKINSYK